MIKRHAFSFLGWVITFIFAYMWRANVELLKNGIQFSSLENPNCEMKNFEKQKSSIKPKKVMILMQNINRCSMTLPHCDDMRMLKKAFLRNYYHKMDREWEQVEITFKFFIGEKAIGFGNKKI